MMSAVPPDEMKLPPVVSALLQNGPPPLTGEEVDGLYSVGLTLYAQEHWAEASDVFRLLVLCRPREARGWIALAACHEGLGDDEQAITIYRIASAAPAAVTNRRRACLFLARLLARLGRRAEARDALENVEDADDGLDDALDELRRSLVETLRSTEVSR